MKVCVIVNIGVKELKVTSSQTTRNKNALFDTVVSVFLFLSLQERLVGKTRNGEDQMKTLGQIFGNMVQRSITLMSWFQMHLNLPGGRAHILMQSSLIVSLFLYKSRSRINSVKSFTLKIQNLSTYTKMSALY